MSAALSVITITPDRFSTVSKTLRCLELQNVADHIEIVIVAPSRDLECDYDRLRRFHSYCVVESAPAVSTAKARAAGVRAASAPIVAFAEDHSFPASDWAKALLKRHEEKSWAAVGPAIANSNPRSITSWANLLIEYSEWLHPCPSGAREHLPGHNSSYKRDLLLEYGDRLEQMLDAESVLHWDLRRKGHGLYLEGAACTFHENFSRPLACLTLRFNGGRLFAAARSRTWRKWRRGAFALGSPLIPFVRFVRIIRELFAPGRPRHLLPRLGPALLAGLLFDGAGELVGYLSGPGGAMAKLSNMEFHRERYLDEKDQLEANEAEPRTTLIR